METKAIVAIVSISILSYCMSLQATNASTARLEKISYNDREEAATLAHAYAILATGDHDYKGHRIKAMHAIKEAADLLKWNLEGDGKYKQSQALSDAKLREEIGRAHV